MKHICTIMLILFVITISTAAQQIDKKKYKATEVETSPVIDGIIDDDAWTKGEWKGEFTEFQPYNGRAANQKTEFQIVFDADNIYIAIKAFDTAPDSIVKRLTRRDEADGDMVGVSFDSYHDQRTAFTFGISVGGVKFDQFDSNDGESNDQTWDPNWWGKASITKEGWVAEMKIPFSQLRFNKSSGDVWGLEVFRQVYRTDGLDFWQPIPKDAPGLIHCYGEIEGLGNIRPRKIFDITPYTVASTERYPAETGNPFATGKDYILNAGLDAKIGVTNNLTLDLTINPDFGQVESDPSTVNLTAYETFYEEKRPFFLEGNNITNFSLGLGDDGIGNDNLFYSRRIGRRPQGYPSLSSGEFSDIPRATTILSAAKLTGKTKDGLSIGFIETVTAEEKAEIDNEGTRTFQTVEPLTNYFLGRLQKDSRDGNTIFGGIVTSVNRSLTENLENSLHSSAYSGGFDFTQYFKEKTWMVNLNAAASMVNGSELALVRTQRSSARYYQRPDASHVEVDSSLTSLTGTGGRFQLIKSGNSHWTFLGSLIWKSPGFEVNDVGYMQDADNIISVLFASYRQWEPKGFYRSYSIGLSQHASWNFGGVQMGSGLNPHGNITFKNFWNFSAGTNIGFSSLSDAILRGGPMMKIPGRINQGLNLSTSSRKKLILRLSTGFGKGFSESSSSVSLGLSATYKPVNTLSLSLSPNYSVSDNQLQYITRRKFEGNDQYIFGSINQKTLSMSFRVNLTITPDLTVQYWGQPFLACGSYKDIKRITEPLASEFTDRFEIFPENNIELIDNSYYAIDQDGNGTTDYTVSNPDFSFQEFLSNFVIRWEYNPGSSVYLVWSQTRSTSDPTAGFNPNENLNDLFTSDPYNVFLVKFSYRFGIK